MEVVSPIKQVETIAEGRGIRELAQLRKRFGPGNWKKKKGIAMIRVQDGSLAQAEVHWYEAHGIGKVKLKVKRWL
ncbi:hypothetical protein [Halochromatium sp.]